MEYLFIGLAFFLIAAGVLDFFSNIDDYLG